MYHNNGVSKKFKVKDILCKVPHDTLADANVSSSVGSLLSFTSNACGRESSPENCCDCPAELICVNSAFVDFNDAVNHWSKGALERTAFNLVTCSQSVTDKSVVR